MAFEAFIEDPKFMALSDDAKKIVLSKSDPKFGALSPEAQDIVLKKALPLSAGDVAIGAFKNIIPDTVNVATNIYKTVTNPSQAIEGMADVVTGAATKILPDWAFKPGEDVQAKRAEYEQAADQFGGHYKERYGGIENIKRSIAEHPAETALDALTVRSLFRGRGKKAEDLPKSPLTPEAEAAAALAKEQGLPLSASAINPTKTAKAFEWVGESLPTGKAWATMKRQQLQSGLNRMMEEFQAKLPKNVDKYDAGTSVAQGIKGARTAIKGKEKAAYREFGESLGKDNFTMENTVNQINKLKGTATGDLRAWFEAFSKKGGEWSPADVEAFQGQIWSKMGNTPQAGEMFNVFKSDVGALSTTLLESAKEQGKLLRTFNSNSTVKDVLRKYSQDPENAIRAMFRTGNMEDLNVVKKALDSETWDIARSRFVQNLFDASTKEGIFDPRAFSDIFSKYQRQIKQVMPEHFDELKNFAGLSKTAVQDVGKLGMKNILSDLPTQLVTTGASGFGLGAGMVVPVGFSFALTKSIMNPSGWMKKWLTEGYKMPDFAIGARRANVLQVGGRQAVQEKQND